MTVFQKTTFRALLVLLFVICATALFAQSEGVTEADFPVVLLTLVGVIAPPIYQYLVRKIKGEVLRFFIILLLNALLGVAALLYLKLPLDMSVQTITYIFTLASAVYKGIWKPLWFNKSIALRTD
jgi:hypothetical protein